ncbi:putative metalloprotease CJM1_0395 family protein [sulfur-oxidizing endosymbiont of Gigantopelta aegis]|uniref:putative metalloprotease CJM1_0395 family protein n=1 Tax=sulfur-oxidizing endosymbiont of Gigantopelta aegis TaxID=2794934 RepID=UPI0018DBC52E|nr:putative metalloprotease CJM1_0395 family protein [sulfur-oxidizing endosymbiont of Gigantopelta aegis]
MNINSAVNSSISPQVYSARQIEGLRVAAAPQDTATFSAQARQIAFADKQNTSTTQTEATQTEATKTAQTKTQQPKILGAKGDSEVSEAPAKQTGIAGKNSTDKNSTDEKEPTDKTKPAEQFSSELSESERLEVEKLRSRDTEVKAHEQAHLSAAGDLAQGGASFDYETGPDNKRYAVGGEVSIDTSAVAGDPQATLNKAQRIRRAASAPADPSSQDRSVAAQASRMEVQARVDISQQVRDTQAQYIDANTPESDFLSPQQDQNDKNIQNTYKRIQNASVLEQKSFIDFFI